MESRRFRFAYVVKDNAVGVGLEGYIPMNTIEKCLFYRSMIYFPKVMSDVEVLQEVAKILREEYPNSYLIIKGKTRIHLKEKIANLSYRLSTNSVYNTVYAMAH